MYSYIYPKRPEDIFHYGIKRRSGRYPYGSGERPFQDMSSSALSVYKIANGKEKTITKDIKEAAKISNSKLYGLENRLKTVDSIQRKMNKKQIEDDKTEKESTKSIHDSVRYTTISDTKDFVSNYESFKKRMTDLGYVEIECKNYFDQFNKGLVKHKAVQSQFSDKDGFIFEVQFQTPESQKAKTEKIPLYEERRKVGINPDRAKKLEKEMEMLALKVPDPPGIEKIKSHSINDNGQNSGVDKNKSSRNNLEKNSSHELTEETLNKYKKQYSNLSHVKIDNTTKGRIYEKNGKVVAMVNTETKPDGTTWIQGLEVFGENKGTGFSRGLLDVAVNDFGATNLSVRKTNKVAKELYEKYGFKTYDSNDFMEFMRIDKLKHSRTEEGVNFKMSGFYYLAHGGPGSGRYPLGSGDRPYQKFEGTGRKRGGISGYIQSVRERKEAKNRIENEKRRASEEEARRRHEMDKERVLKRGSATEVLKYQGELTNKELNDVAERIRLENQLKTYSEKEIESSLDKVKKIQSYTNVASALTKDGVELWNNLAAIYNATPKGKKKQLSLIKK